MCTNTEYKLYMKMNKNLNIDKVWKENYRKHENTFRIE